MWLLYICMLAVETGCMKVKTYVHKTQESCYEQIKLFEEQDTLSLSNPVCIYKETL